MMLLYLLLVAANQNGWPFREEPAATQVLESYTICLRDARIARGNDNRTPSVLAREIISHCRSQRDTLLAALTEIYTRKPDLLAGGQAPPEGASGYVNRLNGAVEPVVARTQIERAYRHCLRQNIAQQIGPSHVHWRHAWRAALAACANEREHVRQVTLARWHGLPDVVAETDRWVSDIEKLEVARRRIRETTSRITWP